MSVVAFEGDAAFEAGADFGDVVLEAPQRGDRAVVDDDVVAGDAGLQRLADEAFGDQQAGRLAVLAGREDLADLGAADDGLDRSAGRARRPSPPSPRR